MKKIMISLLAAVFVLSMGIIPAFAGTETATAVPYETSIDVNGKYSEAIASPDVYSVAISWGKMEFTYNVGGTRNWDPETHTYSNDLTSEWTADGNGITVTNHSNVPLNFGFSFTENLLGIAGGFYDASSAGNEIPSDTLSVASAVGTEYANAPSATAYLQIKSGEVSSDEKIGTVTVSINTVSISEVS